MSTFRLCARAFVTVVVGLAAGLSTLPAAWSQIVPAPSPNHESILVDGQTFKITPGTAKSDAADRIKALGARELGPGASSFARARSSTSWRPASCSTERPRRAREQRGRCG